MSDITLLFFSIFYAIFSTTKIVYPIFYLLYLVWIGRFQWFWFFRLTSFSFYLIFLYFLLFFLVKSTFPELKITPITFAVAVVGTPIEIAGLNILVKPLDIDKSENE